MFDNEQDISPVDNAEDTKLRFRCYEIISKKLTSLDNLYKTAEEVIEAQTIEEITESLPDSQKTYPIFVKKAFAIANFVKNYSNPKNTQVPTVAEVMTKIKTKMEEKIKKN